MKTILEIELDYQNKLIDLKYEKATNLLDLLSDETYLAFCNENADLVNPIASSEGNSYLHNGENLDKLIEKFIEYINRQEPDFDHMNEAELIVYIENEIEDLDQERLCGIAKVIKNMLGK